ncbi:MAG: RluA family pseudouridine synthase [Alphaproteobacteria bacterium]|nr:RluA family pseudouridine synthase [Alphaproteobacteria bacterium]
MNMTPEQNIEIPEDLAGNRLDKALSLLLPEFSRARLQALVKGGHVTLGGQICDKMSVKVKAGDHVSLVLPPLEDAEPEAQDIPLDIIYEDEHLLVINKAAGLVVHPGAGNHDGTLVNALLHHCGDSLSGIGGVARPGIVHRIDKDTTGLLVVAKHDQAHRHLSEQLADRSLSRVYMALAFKTPVPKKGSVNQPIARDSGNRLKMALNRRTGKEAQTDYLVRHDFEGALSLLECKLHSGRTHQIRVHMQSIGHPLIGDTLYGPQKNAVEAAMKRAGFSPEQIAAVQAFPRQALHAASISFIHPETEDWMEFDADLPDDLSNLLKIINN